MLNLNIIEWRSWGGIREGWTFWDWALVLLLNWPDWPWATHSISLLLSFQMQSECIPPGGLEVPLNLRFCSFIPWTVLIFLIPQIHQSPEVPFYYKWFLYLHPNNFPLLVENRISHWALGPLRSQIFPHYWNCRKGLDHHSKSQEKLYGVHPWVLLAEDSVHKYKCKLLQV